jgi:uncharacterized membrane protein
MHNISGKWYLPLILLVAGLVLPAVYAAGIQDYTTTYTITLGENGTALWNIEYRTPLSSDNETATFEEYSRALNSTYLPEIENLMKSSATQAASATLRPMSIEHFSGTAGIQTTPTGKFGVVTVSFSWDNFSAGSGDTLAAGDAFAGGLYLSKDTVLIIRYPAGFSEVSVLPEPDQREDATLIWYGIRSFSIGQPAITLEKTGFPLYPAAAGCIILVLAGAGFVLYRRKKHDPAPAAPSFALNETPDESEGDAAPLSEADRHSLEERILRQLRDNGGEQYQSELVKGLGIPKSTLSSTLNILHQRGIIVKIKKGRENLVRLTGKAPQSPGASQEEEKNG